VAAVQDARLRPGTRACGSDPRPCRDRRAVLLGRCLADLALVGARRVTLWRLQWAAAVAVLLLVAVAVAFIAARHDGDSAPVEFTSATELLERFRRPVTDHEVRWLLGDPTLVEPRLVGTLWTYERPFGDLARLQVRIGERRRVAAVGFSFISGAPSLGAQLERDFGSRCSGWAATDETVWCFEPAAVKEG
jgi:hypothetical protein